MTETQRNQALHEVETMMMRTKAVMRYLEQIQAEIEAILPTDSSGFRNDNWAEETVSARKVADLLNAVSLLTDSITVSVRATCQLLGLRAGSVYARVGKTKEK